MIDPYSPSRIADRCAIEDVILRWCRAIDRLDTELMRDVFHEDATDDHGPYSGDIPGLIAWVEQRHRLIPFSAHQVSNILVEFVSEDQALVETYVRMTQTYPENARDSLAQLIGGDAACIAGEIDLMSSARYIDRFERRNGRWRIARRTVVNDWRRAFGGGAFAELNQGVATAKNTGRRDRHDVLYRERRSLGLDESFGREE